MLTLHLEKVYGSFFLYIYLTRLHVLHMRMPAEFKKALINATKKNSRCFFRLRCFKILLTSQEQSFQ